MSPTPAVKCTDIPKTFASMLANDNEVMGNVLGLHKNGFLNLDRVGLEGYKKYWLGEGAKVGIKIDDGCILWGDGDKTKIEYYNVLCEVCNSELPHKNGKCQICLKKELVKRCSVKFDQPEYGNCRVEWLNCCVEN